MIVHLNNNRFYLVFYWQFTVKLYRQILLTKDELNPDTVDTTLLHYILFKSGDKLLTFC